VSAEENMALVRRFWEARVVKRDLDAVEQMLAPDFVNRNKLVPGQKPDREDYLRGIAAFHAAQSQGQLIIEDQVAGGGQGGDPLRRARPPRSGRAYGRGSYR
jgi:hypothetical protein